MAFVPLHPIGSARDSFLDEQEVAKNGAFLNEHNAQLNERRAEVKSGWGDKYVERTHAKGKMTAWERIEAIRDEGAPVHPVGTFVNWGVEFDA
ncbi:MAG: propionyl-CoA carboxylase, partial [Planctomycetes bacterium]|nr:propionyl-CoA carboxylase [Planctomycetota bacterium]